MFEFAPDNQKREHVLHDFHDKQGDTDSVVAIQEIIIWNAGRGKKERLNSDERERAEVFYVRGAPGAALQCNLKGKNITSQHFISPAVQLPLTRDAFDEE